jgi:hypothetical protein
MYKRLRHGFAYFVGRDRAMRPALVFRALLSFRVETYGEIIDDMKKRIEKVDQYGFRIFLGDLWVSQANCQR